MNASGASLVFDGAGNLYGTAGSGGVYGAGVVFELTPTSSGWAESVLYSFSGAADGGYPYAGLIFDSAGSLYGTTWGGGRVDCGNGCGVVFKLAPTSSGWIEGVLYAFGPNGQNSDAELVFDGASNLYGVTWYPGAYGWGVVFKLSPNSDGSWIEVCCISSKGLQRWCPSSSGPDLRFTRQSLQHNPRMNTLLDMALFSNWCPTRMEAGRSIPCISSRAARTEPIPMSA